MPCRSIARFAFLLGAAALFACAGPSTVVGRSPGPSVISASPRSLSPAQLGKGGAVRITTAKGQGSGTYLGGSVVVTAAHVVAGALTIGVDYGTKRVTDEAPIVAADLDSDLALAVVPALDKLGAEPLTWGAADALQAGDRVFAFGYPLDAFSATAGRVSALRQLGRVVLIQADVPIDHGSSGGPLLNEAGDLVGIADFVIPGVPGLGFFVSANSARAFLARTDLPRAISARQNATNPKPMVPAGFSELSLGVYASLANLGVTEGGGSSLRVTALALTDEVSSGRVTSMPGNRVLTVTMRFENSPRGVPHRVLADNFTLIDSSGRTYFSNSAATSTPGALLDAELDPGQSIDGTVSFEVSASGTQFVLLYYQPDWALFGFYL
jgi:hypothetical protein